MWKTVESMENPTTIDTASSKKWVYIRRNIEGHERVDEMSGETVTYYTFEEMKIPKENYPIYDLEVQNAANLDYIAMMTDIDIDDDDEEE